MSLLNSVVAAATETHLTAPAWIFPAVAATLFVALGFIVWSFRDVANRHTNKLGGDQH